MKPERITMALAIVIVARGILIVTAGRLSCEAARRTRRSTGLVPHLNSRIVYGHTALTIQTS